jgi:hypothetical protein
MTETSKILTAPWLAATTLLWLLLLSGCARQPSITVLPSDRTITPLPSGNYEVTPAWLQERYRTERWLHEELKRCKEGGR